MTIRTGFTQVAIGFSLWFLFASAAVAATPSQPAVLFAPVAESEIAADTATNTPRSREIQVRADLLATRDGQPRTDAASGRLELNLFPDVSYVAVRSRIDRNPSGSFTWCGRIEGAEHSEVTLVVRDGLVVGKVTVLGRQFRFGLGADGRQRVEEVDLAAFPPEMAPLPADNTGESLTRDSQTSAGGQGLDGVSRPMVLADDGSLIDVMVVYTAAARTGAGGAAAMQSLIDLAISETNTGYANSGITPRLRLVRTAPVDYADDPTLYASDALFSLRNLDGFMDEVLSNRDLYTADLVVMIVENAQADGGGSVCGASFQMNWLDHASEANAFAVVKRDCVAGNFALAHETGHTMGANHDRYTSPQPILFDYSHGYVNTTDLWRTIMAENGQCEPSTCQRLNYWSNPDVSYGGDPMGVVIGDPAAADNRSSLNNAALVVANFRARAISINDVTVTEGNSGTRTANFTVTLNLISGRLETVDYATADGTAHAPADYTASTGTISFPAGTTTRTVSIPLITDTLFEPDETFTVVLSNPNWSAIDKGTGTATITNDDIPGEVQFVSATYTVSEAGPNAVISVKRTGGAASGVTVDYATSDGTAVAGSDYNTANGFVSFGAAQTLANFAVPIINDTIVESSETVNLTLSGPTGGATLGTQTTAVLTITNNDLGGVIQFSSPTYSVNEAGPVAAITVTRTSGAASDVTVNFATANGTALAGLDYTTNTGTLTFGAGEASKTFAVPILEDVLGEGPETVNLTLSGVAGGGSLGTRTTAVLTIVDNETMIQFSAPTYTVSEVSASALITVSRAGPLTVTSQVNYATHDGTATKGSDYTETNGTLTFTPGVTSRTITVPIINDTVDEPNETVVLSLQSPVGAVLGPRTTSALTITDNDVGGIVQFSLGAYSVSESGGTVKLTVTRTGGAASGVTVDYTTSDGTATAGSDYTTTADTLTFGAGEMSKTFSVPILGDATGEGNETFAVTLSNTTGGATLGTRSTATVTILDDEGFVYFAAASPTIVEGSTAVITVKRTNSTGAGVTVDYATSDGTAHQPGDYTTSTGTLTFGAGVTSMTFRVVTVANTLDEPNKTVNLTLSGPVGIGLGLPNTAVLTITDNDVAGTVQLSSAVYNVSEAAGQAVITVSRTGGAASDVTVNYATSDGTAVAPGDYGPNVGTLTFGASELSKTFAVSIVNDTEGEGTETVNLTLSGVGGGGILGARSTAVLNILDNDGYVTFGVPSYVATEGRTVAIVVKRFGSTAPGVTVDYSTSDGTATAPADYTTTNGTLTFGTGVYALTVLVPITGDATPEGPETFTVSLSSVMLDVVGSPVTVTINDDDGGGVIEFVSSTYTVAESTSAITLTVRRTGSVLGGTTVDFTTNNGTATAGSDYGTTVGTLTFAAGQTSKTVSVLIINDTVDEPNETFTVTLSNPQPSPGTTIGTKSSATVTITDNDTAGTVQFASAQYSVSESAGTAVITVTRTGGTSSGATIDYATSDGTATAGSDYTTATGTLTFGAGVASLTFSVPITNDAGPESSETVILTLSNPGGRLTLGAQSTATLWIADDDS